MKKMLTMDELDKVMGGQSFSFEIDNNKNNNTGENQIDRLNNNTGVDNTDLNLDLSLNHETTILKVKVFNK